MKMTIQFVLPTTMIILACWFPKQTQAQVVVLSNLGGGTDSSYLDIGNNGSFPDIQAAVGFSTPTPYALDSVMLRLRVFSSQPVVGIYSDSGGNPAALLTTLNNPTFNSGTISNYTFTPDAAFNLNAGTTYWIVHSDATGFHSWYLGGTPTGSATYAGTRINFNGLPNSNYSALPRFAVNATAVPEPTSFALFGIALVGMARRRRLR